MSSFQQKKKQFKVGNLTEGDFCNERGFKLTFKEQGRSQVKDANNRKHRHCAFELEERCNTKQTSQGLTSRF